MLASDEDSPAYGQVLISFDSKRCSLSVRREY